MRPYKYIARDLDLLPIPWCRNYTMSTEDLSEGVAEVSRDAPPAHYSFKIQSFSLLSVNSIVKYESCVFELGGYKWKLLLYPKGDPAKYVDDHLSLYLAIDDTSSLPTDWVVSVTYRFFIFDKIWEKYLTFGDAGGTVRKFHSMRTSWGLSKLMSLTRFENPANGYLVDDSCEFGVEIFIAQPSCGSERLEMITRPATCNYSWKIENFSQLEKEYYYSDVFTSGGYKWKIQLRPKGERTGKGNGVSLFLFLSELGELPSNAEVHTRYKLSLKNQTHGSHVEREAHSRFFEFTSGWGWDVFLSLESLKDPNKGFLLNDVLVVEAEVTVLGSREKNTPA